MRNRRTMDHVCSHLGAVHLGTPGVGMVDGSLALARRLIDFDFNSMRNRIMHVCVSC